MTQYSFAEVLSRTKGDAQPPLYYLTLTAWTAVFGDSDTALFGLSCVLCLGTITLTYLVCCRFGRIAGLVGAAALAMSAAELVSASSIRMYPLGAFLTAASVWMLMRALDSGGRSMAWWTAYGVTAAALCYTHYFAFFTLFAQTVFVLGYLGWRCRQCRNVRGQALGFVWSGAIAVALFAPWLPSFLNQFREVHEQFWIPAVSVHGLERDFTIWLTGAWQSSDAMRRIIAAVLLAFAIWATVRGGRLGFCFGLMAFVPWIAAVAFSVLSGRSIVLDRCFVFAHVALCGLWAAAWHSLRKSPARILFVWVLASTTITSFIEFWASRPHERAVWESAAIELLGKVNDGDSFVLDDYREINRFRYYTMQAGHPWLRVMARVPTGPGHVVHRSSLKNDEILPPGIPFEDLAPGRVWRVAVDVQSALSPVQGKKMAWQRTFQANGESLTVSLFE